MIIIISVINGMGATASKNISQPVNTFFKYPAYMPGSITIGKIHKYHFSNIKYIINIIICKLS